MTFGEWELLAKQGIAEAEYNLGLMFSRGKEVPRDDKKAVKWYRLAAEQGLAQSQTNLGLMFGKGHKELNRIIRRQLNGIDSRQNRD